MAKPVNLTKLTREDLNWTKGLKKLDFRFIGEIRIKNVMYALRTASVYIVDHDKLAMCFPVSGAYKKNIERAPIDPSDKVAAREYLSEPATIGLCDMWLNCVPLMFELDEDEDLGTITPTYIINAENDSIVRCYIWHNGEDLSMNDLCRMLMFRHVIAGEPFNLEVSLQDKEIGEYNVSSSSAR